MVNVVLNIIMATSQYFFYQPTSSDFNPSASSKNPPSRHFCLEIILKGMSYNKKKLGIFRVMDRTEGHCVT